MLTALLPPGLIALLGGCGGGGLEPPRSLHVRLVPSSGTEWMKRDYLSDLGWRPLLKAFRKLHPDVSVQVTIDSEATLVRNLEIERSRGLGPDLLLVRAPVAISLQERKLVDPLPSTPAMKEALSLLQPLARQRVTTAAGVAAMPVFSEITLACMDRRRVPQAPATLTQLLQLAASGQTVGLSADPIGIWWTVGALGAQRDLAPMITGAVADPKDGPEARVRLLTLLIWLRQAALQSRVDLASGDQELTEGLESGRLAWIPCFSLSLAQLDRRLGRHLHVAPLPAGPAGPPTPFSALRTVALGVDSSPGQRRLALELVGLSLNDLVQRDMTLSTRMILPANRFVPMPVASSGRLAALAAAQSQFDDSSFSLLRPYSLDEVNRVLPHFEAIVTQVMTGMISPEQGAEALLALRRRLR
ncbi:MAG: hypothetical protein VKI83_04410 [Synechococcaceae cyanobacterium]|nr:hypothetical protein [Synechococcaceae cyanobacterium]